MGFRPSYRLPTSSACRRAGTSPAAPEGRKQLDKGDLLPNAELAGTVQLWEWIGDEGATTFSY